MDIIFVTTANTDEEARELLEGYNLNIPISYMWADVCRDELLIEIEGIAIR